MDVTGISFEKPGAGQVHLKHLFLDFNGTLALDGKILPTLPERIRAISSLVSVTVVTADTFGSVHEALRGLPVRIEIAKTGRDKANLLSSLVDTPVTAIGNGRNDVEMFHQAALAIGVLGPEGLAAELILASTIVVRQIEDAFDLLLNPTRLKATLRA